MPCEISVLGVGKKAKVFEKGYPMRVQDCPCVWGQKQHPPNWVIVRITDASKAQVEHFLSEWRKYFSYEILAVTDEGYRIKVTVDPALISVSGVNRELRADLKDHIVTNYGAVIISYDGNEAIVDIPKPVDLLALKADIYDIFSERADKRFYYFSSEDVDLAVAQGGFIELTRAQALNRIKNKLDE